MRSVSSAAMSPHLTQRRHDAGTLSTPVHQHLPGLSLSLSTKTRFTPSRMWWLVLGLLVTLTWSLSAAHFKARWVGTTDGEWSTPANWDIGRVPNNTPQDTYDVLWDAHPVTVTLDRDTVIRNFTFASSGRLQGQSSQTKLIIEGEFVWNRGVLAIRDRTTVKATATIQGDGANFRTLETGQLWLQGRTVLHSGLHLLNAARVVNDLNAVFEARDGARFSTGGNLTTDIINLGTFHVGPGSQSFISVQFRNEGLLEISHRTMEFATPGAQVEQRGGKVELDEANVEGLLTIMAGSLEGNGFVRDAIVLGSVSGRLTFGKLTPGNNAISAFKMSGRPGESSDRFSAASPLQLGGTLYLTLIRAVPGVLDVFELISAPAGVMGRFSNVNFGERVLVANTTGSFLIQLAPDSKSVSLSDYRYSQLPQPPPEFVQRKKVQCVDCIMCLIFAVFGAPDDPAGLAVRHALTPGRLLSAGAPLPSTSDSPAVFHALQSLLKSTTEGRRLVDLFWRHTAEVVEISLAHPSLLEQLNLVVRSFEPGVAALLAGNGPGATITPAMIDQLNLLWSILADNASPSLRAALLEELTRFDGFQHFVNTDFSRWAHLLEISAPTQPWVHLSTPTKSTGHFGVDVNNIPGFEFSLWRSANLAHWERVPFAEVQKGEFTTRLIDPTSPSENTFYAVRH